MQKSTNNPYFDEYMVFQIVEAPAKLFEELITFEVLNARRFQRDARIGTFSVRRSQPDRVGASHFGLTDSGAPPPWSFYLGLPQLDVGLVYEEANHQFPRTWLMVTNSENGEANVTGYLKVTMTVLGPVRKDWHPQRAIARLHSWRARHDGWSPWPAGRRRQGPDPARRRGRRHCQRRPAPHGRRARNRRLGRARLPRDRRAAKYAARARQREGDADRARQRAGGSTAATHTLPTAPCPLPFYPTALQRPSTPPSPSHPFYALWCTEDMSLKTGMHSLDRLTGQDGKEDCDPYVRVSFAGKVRFPTRPRKRRSAAGY